MRQFRLHFGFLCVGTVVFLVGACTDNRTPAGETATTEQPRRPNILFIVADDMGYSDLGVFGGEIPTPNLDALARSGMLLTDFYAGMTCGPTRAMLMSGTDHHIAGMGVQGRPSREDQLGQPGYEGYLNFRVASLAELMTDAGYNTYMTGKWHLGEEVEHGPRARGFKRSFVSLDGAAHLGGWDWRGPQPARYRDGDELVQVGDDFYTTRFYTQRMIEYIEQDRADGKPFFAYLAYTAPHWPLQAPAESIARFKGRYDSGYEALYESRFARQKELGLVRADAEPIDPKRFRPRWSELSEEERRFEARRMEIYAAMVGDLDTYVGEIIAYLERIGELDDTFIMFMSDNGAEASRRDLVAPISEHVGKEYDHSLENLGSASSYVMYGANWASVSATPFFRHKATGFEGGIKVPAFVHFPRMVEAGSRSDGVGTVRDLLPTFLAVARAQPPGTTYRGMPVVPIEGASLLPMLTGEAAEAHPAGTVFGWELLGQRSVRQGNWKIVWDQRLPAAERRWQLFDLEADPFEQHDLSTSNPAQLAVMERLWEQYDDQNGVIY
ncbi:MAG TPA: sulfatase-like hydrolase/transferase [Gammaproteobacteria bacterium]